MAHTANAALHSLARCVASSIKADGAADAFIANPNIQVEMCEAYAINEVRKFDAFTTTYLANPEARTAFQMTMFEMLKAGA